MSDQSTQDPIVFQLLIVNEYLKDISNKTDGIWTMVLIISIFVGAILLFLLIGLIFVALKAKEYLIKNK